MVERTIQIFFLLSISMATVAVCATDDLPVPELSASQQAPHPIILRLTEYLQSSPHFRWQLAHRQMPAPFLPGTTRLAVYDERNRLILRLDSYLDYGANFE